ncbi:uncharacterized protein [Rutidosis leptorrhynchoides]|uniref:uncharacterized protein n=1 Tax=Rutidosis leptorrhynchoides TaxID=125765 RepID=UPI003A9A3C64
MSLCNSIQLHELLRLLSVVQIDELDEDKLVWSASSEDVYSVSDAVRILVQSNFDTPPSWPKVVRGNNVPSKVMLFHWLAIRNNISVKDVLIKRHVLPYRTCVSGAWRKSKRVSFDWFYGMGIKASKYWKLIDPATIWEIWLARNNFIFNGKFMCHSVFVRNIKLKTFLWATNLKFCNGLHFYVWDHNPSLLCY